MHVTTMKNGAGHWMQATTGSWRQPLLSTIEYPWQHSATVARTRRGGVLGLWPALFRHRRLSRASERLSPLLPGTRSHPRCLEWTAAIAVCAQSALATIATNARHPTQHGLSESLQRRFSVGSQILLRRNLVPRVSVSASTVRIQSIQTTHGPMEAFGASHAAYSTQHWSPTLSLRVPSASNPSSKQEQLSFLKRTLLEGAVIEACVRVDGLFEYSVTRLADEAVLLKDTRSSVALVLRSAHSAEWTREDFGWTVVELDGMS